MKWCLVFKKITPLNNQINKEVIMEKEL